jgi:16S rRNA (cytosine1402-N4)-methyltransferase
MLMASLEPHVPVLRDRVVALLTDAPDGLVVDATVGAGGHAAALLLARAERHGRAALLGLDRDPSALALAEPRLAEARAAAAGLGDAAANVEVTLVRTRFDALGTVLDALDTVHGRPFDGRIAGFLLDLGISSMHVDVPERGFSYRHEGPLDMRMDPDQATTAADLVNDLPVDELAAVLRRHADERHAGRIARAIVAARPVTTTTELADIVRSAIPAAARRTGGHPATRTFQALRIAVNAELTALEAVLPVALERLVPGGVGVTLAYHSLEDRIVKRAFADAARGCVCPPELAVCGCGRHPLVAPLVRRPQRPDDAEIAANPRASAARLRAVRRLPDRSPT